MLTAFQILSLVALATAVFLLWRLPAREPAPREAGPAARSSKRLLELDVLRGLAALWVVAEHFTSDPHRQPYMDDLAFNFPLPAFYGVQLFFLISGFVIFMTIERVRTGGEFVRARASRLYPAYWTAVILTFVVVSLFRPELLSEVSLPDALFNLTMLQDWFQVPQVDNVYWTLAVELAFYTAICLLFISGLLRRVEWVAVVWLAVVMAARLAENAGLVRFPGAVQITFLLPYTQLFLAGILFYKVRNRQDTWATHVLILTCWATQPWVFWGGTGGVGVVVATVCFALFYAFAYDRLRWIAWAPLIFLGTISYSLYLTHQNIGMAFILNLNDAEVNPNVSVLLAVALSLLIATAITFGVEHPCMRLLRARKKAAAPAGELPLPTTVQA